MFELLYKQEVFQLVGLCMEIHRELGKGHDEVIYKDALVVELTRAGIPFLREKNYEITYKGVVLPHYYYAYFVIWDKILFEAKAVEKLNDSHIKQVLNYLAASQIRVGLLVNFGADSWNGNGSSYRHTGETGTDYTIITKVRQARRQFVQIREIRVPIVWVLEIRIS
jgi:GxxExxY protein